MLTHSQSCFDNALQLTYTLKANPLAAADAGGYPHGVH
jgi:hypothetical protein